MGEAGLSAAAVPAFNVALWEEAIRAQGGRERLRSVQNLLISSTIGERARAGQFGRPALRVVRGVELVTDKPERNKQAVTAFYDLTFNQCKPAEAVEKYVGDVYIQHNPVARPAGGARVPAAEKEGGV